MNFVARICLLLLLALGLSACGVRTAYNNLDWLTVRWVNQQVSLDDDQEQVLRSWLDDQLGWHCATELAAYTDWIEQLRLDVLRGQLDQQQLAAHGQILADFGRRLSLRTLPVMTDLAASLSDEQVTQLMAELDERTDKLRERVELFSPEELAERRLQSMQRSLTRLMGRTNNAQNQRLEAWAHALTPTETYQLAQRHYWRDRLAGALDQREDPVLLETTLADLLSPETAWPDEYRAAMETNRGITLAALEEIIALADQRHLNRMSARLSSLKRDFERLSCSGETPEGWIAATGPSY